MKFLHAAVALVLSVIVQFACSTGLFAQTPSPTPEPMDVKISFSPNEEITLTGEEASQKNIVPTVTLTPNQAVAISLQFPSEKVGAPVMVGTYDGGQISGIDEIVFVPEDGVVPFTFQPGQASGTYRVLVQVGGDQNLLQFRVSAPE